VIRRFSVAVAAVVLTGTVASGCSTFSKNDQAAKAGGSALSIEDFQGIIADLTKSSATASATNSTLAGDPTTTTLPDIAGSDGRGILTRWVASHLLTAALAKAGSPVDAAAITKATADMTALAAAAWPTFSPATQKFFVDERAAINTVASPSYITDAQVQAAYEAGLATSNTLCLRYIAFTDATAATGVYKQLIGGADFASMADANNTDSTVGKGGIYANSQTKSECSSASTLNNSVAQSLSLLALDTPSQPVTLSGSDGSSQYFIFLERPYSEVAAAAGPIVRQALAPVAEKNLIGTSSAAVDSRYGTWDPTTLTVVATK
jgi:hypothetical protein